MSTIFYEADELANVAAAVNNQFNYAGDLGMIAEALATYSRDNARAFNVRYPTDEKAVAVTETEIRENIGAVDYDQARRTALLMQYNLDGEATKESLEACVFILGRLLKGAIQGYL